MYNKYDSLTCKHKITPRLGDMPLKSTNLFLYRYLIMGFRIESNSSVLKKLKKIYFL